MSYQTNTKVTGTYHGQTYSGTILEVRRHTIHPTRIEHTIELESPIIVYGTTRTRIIVATDDKNENNTILGA